MRFDRLGSCENIPLGSRPRQFFPSPLPTLQTLLSLLEETLLQPVLKSLITVFILYNKGMENKLTRAPLLGLATTIYYLN